MYASLHFPQQRSAAEIGAALRLINAGGYITLPLDHFPPQQLAPGTPVDRIELELEGVLTVRGSHDRADEWTFIPDLTLVIRAGEKAKRFPEVTQVTVTRFGTVTFGSTHNFRVYREGRMPSGCTEKYLVTLVPQPRCDSALIEIRREIQAGLAATLSHER